MKNNVTKTYNAMGFVEALIAIMIAGMASVVLMGLSASALKEAIQNERIDNMTQYAVEGGNMIRTILEDEERKEVILGTLRSASARINTPQCFIPITGSDSFDFYDNGTGYWNQPYTDLVTSGVLRRNILSGDLIPKIQEDEQFVRIACLKIKNGNDDEPKYLMVEIGIAHLPSKGDKTTEKEIKDYFYTTTINL